MIRIISAAWNASSVIDEEGVWGEMASPASMPCDWIDLITGSGSAVESVD